MTIGADNIEQIGNGNPDGSTVGYDTTEKVGFYGTTPIAQRSGSAQASTITTAVGSALQTTNWAWTTSTQPAALIASLNEMRASMIAIGIIKGSA